MQRYFDVKTVGEYITKYIRKYSGMHMEYKKYKYIYTNIKNPLQHVSIHAQPKQIM